MPKDEVVAIPDVLVTTADAAHGNCAKAVLHRVPDAETSCFSVMPGETLVAHVHPRTWDLFFGIAGTGEIAYRRGGEQNTIVMGPRAFCAMPPGHHHEVRNLSANEPFSFLLIHAPWDGYQFVHSQEDESPDTESGG